MSSLMHSYRRLVLTPEKGAGSWIWDTQGNKYLDALSGIAVCALGHANKAISKAICSQSEQLIHTSNLYSIPAQEALGETLCKHADMDSIFFCNSGAEANEAAIKIARLYAHSISIRAPEIVVTEGAFHGRTMATLTATGNRKIQAGFEPLVQGFVRAPYNNIEALEHISVNSKNVVAIMIEPIQGEGGIIIPGENYLTAVREICDKNNWLMILDEIQTGMGRTGKWFAWQHENAKPDVLTSAKALGNGFPIGACMASGKAAKMIIPGTHGSTFGGNPLGCTVSSAVISEIESNGYVARCKELGDRLLHGFETNLSTCSMVKDIRGKGLMIGIELDRDCNSLMQTGIENGLLINVTAGNVIRLLPPYILTNNETDEIISKVSKLILDFESQ